MYTVAAAPIEIREDGVAWIIGTNIKAIEVALDHLALGWSPEEIYFQHYGHLSLAQIHGALAYYFEHQGEFDAEIKAQLDEVEQLRKEAGETPGRKRLRALGLLS
jgi:uncharacterized protein (DUF433 family)